MGKEFAVQFVNIFFTLLMWLLFIRVILTWFRLRDNRMVRLIVVLTEPLLALGRRVIHPTRMGLDFSPIVVFLALSVMRSVIINALLAWIP